MSMTFMVRYDRRCTSVLAALVLAAIGCESPTRPPDASLTPPVQWAGGSVRVQGLAPATDTMLFAGDVRLQLSHADGDILVYLPATANGRVEIQRQGALPASIGEVDVIGFADSTWHSAWWTGNPVLWPREGPASFIAGNADGNASLFEVGSGNVRVLFDQFTIRYGDIRAPGLTRDPDVFLFGTGYQDGQGVEAWRIGPVLEHVETYPGVMSLRQLVLVNDSVWLQAGSQQIRRLDVSGALLGEYYHPESQGAMMSPRGDRTAFRVYSRLGRIPVFDQVGDTAFNIAGITWSSGIAFSPSGDTLYVAGSPSFSDGAVHLQAFDATSGDVLETVDYPGYFPQDMIADTSGRWLLIAMTRDDLGALDGGGVHVLVVDRHTMNVAGHMEAPLTDRCYPCDITVVDGSDGVFVVLNGNSDGMLAYRFRRP